VSEILPGIREALAAMNRGDVEPLVSLLDPDVDWRGPSRGHLWWKRTPGCHGVDDARENFKLQVAKAKRRPGPKALQLEQVEQAGDRVVVGGRGTMDGPSEDAGQFIAVLTVRRGRIVDIQGCRGRREATRYAKRGG
jgi:ketosteroid isomerase-like protein